MTRFRGMNPKTHPKFFTVLALVIGALMGLMIASKVSGWPAFIWGTPAAQEQLADLGYTKVKDQKLPHDGLKRDVTTEWWERDAEPQQVVLSDDTPGVNEGELVVNAVDFRGTDGKGTASCQPKPDEVRSHVRAMINDADEVRAGIANGSLKPGSHPGGFPYGGELVGCLP